MRRSTCSTPVTGSPSSATRTPNASRPFVARYGEVADDEPERLHSAIFQSGRSGPLALLRDLHDALGLFLLLAGAAMLIPFAAACLGKLVAAAVLGTTALRFALTGLYQMTADSGLEQAAGIVGLLLLAIALYAALALTLEDARGEAALPVGRRGDGTLDDGLAKVEREAGVRRQL